MRPLSGAVTPVAYIGVANDGDIRSPARAPKKVRYVRHLDLRSPIEFRRRGRATRERAESGSRDELPWAQILTYSRQSRENVGRTAPFAAWAPPKGQGESGVVGRTPPERGRSRNVTTACGWGPRRRTRRSGCRGTSAAAGSSCRTSSAPRTPGSSAAPRRGRRRRCPPGPCRASRPCRPP